MQRAHADSWDEFAEAARDLETGLSLSESKSVRAPTKRAARGLAQSYFREVRAHLVDVGMPAETVSRLDDQCRRLLETAAKTSSRVTYVALVAEIQASLAELTPLREILLGKRGPGAAVISDIEQRIGMTLEQMVPSAAHSYQQALIDLSTSPRVSYRGVAHELREALRETLDHLAPDGEVMAEPGFMLEPDLTRPSQKQKALHILRKRRMSKASVQPPALAVEAIEAISASLARSTYTSSSMSAHTPTTATDVRQMKMYVDAVLAELLALHAER